MQFSMGMGAGIARARSTVFGGMQRNRCTNPQNDHWRWYGAVGIEFQLESFPEFLSLVGLKPQARLCRIDREDDYRPGNVQWK